MGSVFQDRQGTTRTAQPLELPRITPWTTQTDMRKLVNLLILLPLAIVLIFLSVANRQDVRFSLDPLNATEPALSVTLPFFVFLFCVLLLGMVIGGTVTWWSQGKYRKELRAKRNEAERYRRQGESLLQAAEQTPEEFAPGLPAISHSDKAA